MSTMSSASRSIHRPATLLARFDAALGKLSMYRLVLVVLSILAAYSLVLNLLGWLKFGLGPMTVSLILCLIVSYAANRGVAALFRLRPHSESALITGLLLYFLFWPSLRPLDLLGLAAACTIAAASKYLLAVRGRHVFNPAALGAWVVGVTGLNLATWWIGTPAMLWAVVPGVLLVLYRTGKLLMGGAFLLVALVIICAELMSRGLGFDEALWQAVAQRPLLFFVGFMLSEPLTMPQRRWQQLLYAAVVAIPFTVPFNLGFAANSPELALLLGNALAFFVNQRRGVALSFVKDARLTPTTQEFLFSPASPVRFMPGQYAELSLPHSGGLLAGRRRTFSITTAPGAERIGFGVVVDDPVSPAKQALLSLKPGERVHATVVGGDFVLPRDTTTPLLLIAGGIGITPFIAQLRALHVTGERRDVVVLLSVRSAEELAYADVLEASGARVVVRCGGDGRLPAFAEPAGPAPFEAARLRELVPDIDRRTAYVSGPPRFVSTVSSAARSAGATSVRTDAFSGY